MSWFNRDIFGFCINLEEPCKRVYITNGVMTYIILGVIIITFIYLLYVLIYKWVKHK